MSLAAILLLVAAPANVPKSAAYTALIEQDLRLATVGYRLASSNAPFCNRKSRNIGWVLHDEQQYPDRKIAASAFQFRQPVSVAAIVAGGPADKAGIQKGDGLTGVNEHIFVWNRPAQAKANSKRLESVIEQIDRELAEAGPVSLELDTLRDVRRFKLEPPAICASRFWVDVRDKKDAGADGDKVRITSGMMNYIADDAELAAVVAHELAHNILGHRNKLNAIKRGKTKATLATEIEADRLSVWLMANAGYDTTAAIRFADRYGKDQGLGFISAGTHLRWKNRARVMRAEIDQIAQTVRVAGKLPPPLLTNK